MHVVLKPNGAPGKEGEQAGIDGMRGVEFVMAAVGQAPPEVLGFSGDRGDQFFHRQQRLRDIRLPVLRRRGDAVDRAHRGFIRVLRTHRRSRDHRRERLDGHAADPCGSQRVRESPLGQEFLRFFGQQPDQSDHRFRVRLLV